MPVQILLQGKILGGDAFLSSGAPSESEFTGRAHWLALLSEVVPRALIAELHLSKLVLGSSGGETFLVVLPDETRADVERFLASARHSARALSGGDVDLVWALTENLGDWTVVRKRLAEELSHKLGTPLAESGAEPAVTTNLPDFAYFKELGANLRTAQSISWSPDEPARFSLAEGKHSWPLGSGPATGADAIALPRHSALNEDGHQAATAAELGARATGRPIWGVLRGDVDSLGVRLRRLGTIEEYVQTSVLYKQFFAGELEVLCSVGEFWRRVTLLWSGGDDFAVYGSWDALIAFAAELQRLFGRFSEEHLKDLPGLEGKTITMALALAPHPDASLAAVYRAAGTELEQAKSSTKHCFHLLGRTLEWKQLPDAAELKDDLTRMVTVFGVSPQYIRELCSLYRETRRGPAPAGERKSRRVERPWRLYGRINRMLGSSRSREFLKARASLITDLVGKNPVNLKLRPSGRVALEWARLSVESPVSSDTV